MNFGIRMEVGKQSTLIGLTRCNHPTFVPAFKEILARCEFQSTLCFPTTVTGDAVIPDQGQGFAPKFRGLRRERFLCAGPIGWREKGQEA